MSELLPCPFCGGQAECHQWWSATISGEYATVCTKCNCGTDYYNTEAEAITAWNTRAEMSYKDALILLDELGLSERTCKQEERGWGTEGDHARVWLTCGHDCMVPTVQDLPNYCPSCGARVVSE